MIKDIDVLEQFCKENDVFAYGCVQFGISKRVVYLKNKNLDIINKMRKNVQTENESKYNEEKILINPIIINKGVLTEYLEACASYIDNCSRVLRSYIINLEYYDITIKKHFEKLKDLNRLYYHMKSITLMVSYIWI